MCTLTDLARAIHAAFMLVPPFLVPSRVMVCGSLMNSMGGNSS